MLLVITPPDATSQVVQRYNTLLGLGAFKMLLRLPEADEVRYEECIRSISPRYRHRVILSDYYHLVPKAGLGGIHLKAERRPDWATWQQIAQTDFITTSVHSLEELEHLEFSPSMALLSPVFDSISKSGYKAAIDLKHCRERLPQIPFPVLALGGVTPDKIQICRDHGFSGGAVLGYLAEDINALRERFCAYPRPEVLTIAGHDPSSGAGLTADIRAIEQTESYPLSVISCTTIQNEGEFVKSLAVETQPYLAQILKTHTPLVAKIGLTASLSEVRDLMLQLHRAGVATIIWDPILQPSYGTKAILEQVDPAILAECLTLCSLLTPNIPEAKTLFGTLERKTLQDIADQFEVSILLKGGHATKSEYASDLLLQPHKEPIQTHVPRTPYDKHGTGCILSATISSYLAHGYSIRESCRLAQWHVDQLRRSNPSKLGYLNTPIVSLKEEKLLRGKLQFITNSLDSSEILKQCQAALQGGVRWIQLRMKEASTDERTAVARSIHKLMQDYPSSILIIDDDVEAVLRADADGVHVGLNDLPPAQVRALLGNEKIIGATCNTTQDIALRALQGVDYIGVGPYRNTTTKKLLSPLLGEKGMSRLVQFNRSLPNPLPMVGIGGIESDDLPSLASIGLYGVALSGVINQADNPQAESSRLVKLINQHF